MNKNKKRNAFFYFMLEWKERKERQGLHFPNGLKDVQSNADCNKEWHGLSEDQKSKYKNKAKNANQNIVKKNAIGIPLEEVEKASMEEAKFKDTMKEYLSLKINKAKELRYVPELKFYVIQANHYYKRILENGSDEYNPAEIGIAEFSLKDGLIRIYHKIINPQIKTGYACEAKEHSSATHQLPTVEGKIGEDSYDVVYKEICKFLESEREDGKLPPLFTQFLDETILNPVMSIMNVIAENWHEKFTIFSIEELFVRLHNVYDDNGYAKLDDVGANELIKKDRHDYKQSIACDYHKSIGVSKYCSMACVQRWVFEMCYYCCQFLDIELKAGSHYPIEEKITRQHDVGLSIQFQSMDLRSSTSSSNSSSSGAIKKYIKNKSERSQLEEEHRRTEATPVSFTNHNKNNSTTSWGKNPQSILEVDDKPLRIPFTKPTSFGENCDTSYDNNFPSLSIGRGRKMKNVTSTRTDYASKFK